MTRVLVARLDSVGDVLVTGPAIRAVAAGADHVVALCGRRGTPAVRLLPGVDEVVEWTAPWIDPEPQPLDPAAVQRLIAVVASHRVDLAVIFTSFHQSPLPLALALRMAGVPRICGISDDYPGSLLDVRHRITGDIPETVRALSLARAAGFELPPGDDGRLALAGPLPDPRGWCGSTPYIVVHPGASVPARAWPAERHTALVARLTGLGVRAVVTGGRTEMPLTQAVSAAGGIDLGGRLDLPQLAGVLAGARCVVVGNTGPAHLAASVGTPVVSLFAPVVPAERWRPYGVRHVLLGDQDAPCRGSRATVCPVEGHPCLSSVTPDDVIAAIGELTDLIQVAEPPVPQEVPA